MLRSASILILCLIPGSLPAQSSLWQQVSRHPAHPTADAPTPTPSQIQQIRRLLSSKGLQHFWQCETGDPTADWLQNLKYSAISLAPSATTFLVEAGAGCGRGGQGANGAMWIVRFTAGHPQLLAAPDLGFNGWLYQIPPATSHGYRDIVLGWHMSSRESNLSYFRYDGRVYRKISAAEATYDEDGQATIHPSTK